MRRDALEDLDYSKYGEFYWVCCMHFAHASGLSFKLEASAASRSGLEVNAMAIHTEAEATERARTSASSAAGIGMEPVVSRPINNSTNFSANGERMRTLGILWGIYGILMVAAAAWIIVYNRTLTMMWGAIISRVADPFAWMGLFHMFLVMTVVMAFVSAAFSLLAAFTLMGGARSSRTLGLIAAAFGMLGTPIGIALGVFTVAALYPMQAPR